MRLETFRCSVSATGLLFRSTLPEQHAPVLFRWRKRGPGLTEKRTELFTNRFADSHGGLAIGTKPPGAGTTGPAARLKNGTEQFLSELQNNFCFLLRGETRSPPWNTARNHCTDYASARLLRRLLRCAFSLRIPLTMRRLFVIHKVWDAWVDQQ